MLVPMLELSCPLSSLSMGVLIFFLLQHCFEVWESIVLVIPIWMVQAFVPSQIG